jgi:hypothetical protein
MRTKIWFFSILIVFNLFIYTCKTEWQKKCIYCRFGNLSAMENYFGWFTTYKYFEITNISCLPSKQGNISVNSIVLKNDTL